MKQIIIDDGTREVPVCNMFGETICTLRFRPADISIMDRFEQLQQHIGETLKPLEGISIKNDGTAEDADGWRTLKGVEAGLIKQLNALLDTTDAAAIFAKRNPFSAVGGKFFCQIVIDALGGLIAEAIQEENAASQEKMQKYMPAEGDANAGAASENADG